MKVSFKQVLNIGVPLLAVGAAAYCVITALRDSKNYENVYDVQNEMKLKNPAWYDSVATKKHPITYEQWDYERRLMDEAMKTDSLVSKAYFEGVQMVRDSLINQTPALN